jgi:UDP-glucuronate decarboxylase
MMRMMGTEDGFTGPLNLGNPEEVTVHDLAALIIQLTHSASRIVYLPAVTDDPQQRQPDISLARSKINFAPSVGLRHGLMRTIAYFRKTLAAGPAQRPPVARLAASGDSRAVLTLRRA